MSVLVCENISGYSRKNEYIRNFSYNFLENKVYAITGKSNAGQKNLLNLLSGKAIPKDGKIYLDGYQLDKSSKLTNRICFIDEDATFPSHLKIVQIFKLMAKIYPNWDTFYAYELLTHFEINHKVMIGSLNRSQKSILFGILNLSSCANITVLNHPLEDADIKDRYDFFKFLYIHHERYPRTFIINASFIDEIDYLVDNLILLDKGVLIARFKISEMKQNFRYLTGKTEVLKSLITGVKVIGIEERGKMLTVCIRQKLTKDEIRKYQKYLIKISDVPIQNIVIYLITLREIKGIS